MKQTPFIALLFLSSQAIAAGGITIQNLPNEPEQPNPVCRDGSGKLANCTPAAGVDQMYLSPIAIDGDGNTLGTVISSRESWVSSRYTLLSDKNYLFLVDDSVGITTGITHFHFDEVNCQGNAYLRPAFQGRVVKSPIAPGSLYYTPSGAMPISVQILSYYEAYDVPYSCSNFSNIQDLIPAYPNNPTITGVLNKGTETNPYTLPITLQRP